MRLSSDELVERYGFAPEAVSQQVRCFGIIEEGPRKGYLCVFTEDTEVDEHATCKSNFHDADRGYDPYGDRRKLVYIFAPRAGKGAA